MLALRLAALLVSLTAPAPQDAKWHITGNFSEACSCAVPCACNFGESPSPHAFCWAVFGIDVDQGGYGDTDLSGLHLAGANGAKGMVWYIDERANPAQSEALKQIGTAMWRKALKANGVTDPKKAPPEFRLLGFKRAKIEQTSSEGKSYLKIVGAGGFSADYIIGLDGMTPVKVENNWSWNVQDGIKAKTRRLAYHDTFGNQYDFKKTNANQGRVDWDDQTPIYFR
jgi:hypothetical protein